VAAPLDNRGVPTHAGTQAQVLRMLEVTWMYIAYYLLLHCIPYAERSESDDGPTPQLSMALGLHSYFLLRFNMLSTLLEVDGLSKDGDSQHYFSER
jgi:hypothetical protein